MFTTQMLSMLEFLNSSSPEIDIQDVIRHELAPFPTSLFKETSDMRLPTGKCVLKNKLKVPVSARHIQPDTVIVDGCALL